MHRKFGKWRNRVSETELDIVTKIAFFYFWIKLSDLHIAGREVQIRLVWRDDIIEFHLIAHYGVANDCLLIDFVGISQLWHIFDQQLSRIHYLRL